MELYDRYVLEKNALSLLSVIVTRFFFSIFDENTMKRNSLYKSVHRGRVPHIQRSDLRQLSLEQPDS